MKSITQIAKETGVCYHTVFKNVKREGLITDYPTRGKATKMRLTIHQEDYIHDILFYSGYFTELTFESKMNIPEIIEIESFDEFKKRTYKKAS